MTGTLTEWRMLAQPNGHLKQPDANVQLGPSRERPVTHTALHRITTYEQWPAAGLAHLLTADARPIYSYSPSEASARGTGGKWANESRARTEIGLGAVERFARH